MAKKHITVFPKPLLDDLVQGRLVPIVGAGLSKNAVVPSGSVMPLWDDIGKSLAKEMPVYTYSGALDAISAFAHEYSRTKLVERLSDLLFIDRATPGKAHRAFCSIAFDIVCTTNFDFLLERQYETSKRYCRPVIDEDQLSIGIRETSLTLLKLHGDLHHPQRLVVTEEDYDRFLETYPLLSTYLANLLISRTALLVGYSLDDPDLRQVWQIIGDRLGKLRRQAYCLMVDASPTDIARFARRGVKVINLAGTKSKYGQILAAAFDELCEYLSTNLIPASQVTEEEPLNQLSLPRGAATRLCFFAVPTSLLSFYKDRVFPLANRHGFVPIVAADVLSPGDSFLAKIDSLIERAVAIVVDATNPSCVFELGLALSKQAPNRILAVVEDIAELPTDARSLRYVVRQAAPVLEPEHFLQMIENWLSSLAKEIGPQLAEEPKRLLEIQAHRAAVISAMTLLEAKLRDHLAKQRIALPTRMTSLRQLLQVAQEKGIVDPATVGRVTGWMRVRNASVHTLDPVSSGVAQEIVEGVLETIAKLEGGPNA
jgi:hypothetical protein